MFIYKVLNKLKKLYGAWHCYEGKGPSWFEAEQTAFNAANIDLDLPRRYWQIVRARRPLKRPRQIIFYLPMKSFRRRLYFGLQDQNAKAIVAIFASDFNFLAGVF